MMGRSILAYLPVNLANILLSFGNIIILTRLFSGAEFGQYALAMITLQFFHMGLLTWIEAAMERFQARAEREGNVNSHLKTLYIAGGIGAVLSWLLMICLISWLPIAPVMKTVMFFALSSTCIQLIFNLGITAHKASHRIGRYSTIYTTHALLSFLIGIFLILATPLRAEAPFIGIIIAATLTLIIDLPFMLKRMKGGHFQAEKLKTYFTYGMPICFSLFLSYMLNSADMYLITGYLGSEAAGAYNAGYNLANRTLETLFVWVAMAVTPIAITALEKEGQERSRAILKDYGSTLLWITLPAATGIALVAQNAGFILGESVRAQAVTIMPLIAFAAIFNGMITYYAQRAFMLSGKTAMFAWTMVPPVILNIALNILWIPVFGLMGAVYATVAAYSVGLVISLIVGRFYFPLPLPIRSFGEISVACMAMACAIYYLPLSQNLPDPVLLIIKASVGASVYAVISLAINTANCREIVLGVLRKTGRLASASPSEVGS